MEKPAAQGDGISWVSAWRVLNVSRESKKKASCLKPLKR
jgi:hypothetical protein